MSLVLYPVSTSEIEVIKDAPSIYCSYGDMDTLQNFKLWMDSITLDDNGCCMDSKQLQYELEDCLFHHNEVIESIKEEKSEKEIIVAIKETINTLFFIDFFLKRSDAYALKLLTRPSEQSLIQ